MTMTVLDSSSMERGASLYEPQPAEVVAIRELTTHENCYALRFTSGRPLGHTPGQFVQVAILGVGECPISVCSSPTRPENFELCVRRVGEVTEHIHALREGDILGIRGPLGHGFEVNELHGKDILIVAGGLGLAPVRSLIQYILDERRRFGAFHLLYGARSPEELLFRDDLTGWRGNEEVNFHVTVDRPDEQWRGRSGVVTPCSTNFLSSIPRPPWSWSSGRRSCSSSSSSKCSLAGFRRLTCFAPSSAG